MRFPCYKISKFILDLKEFLYLVNNSKNPSNIGSFPRVNKSVLSNIRSGLCIIQSIFLSDRIEGLCACYQNT